MDNTLLQELKTALEKERATIITELQSFAKKDPAMPGDWDAVYPKFETSESGSHAARDEEADEVEEYESLLAAEHSLESRLLEITQALDRMKQGIYGICSRCKKPIPRERLTANPAAAFDIEHSGGTT